MQGNTTLLVVSDNPQLIENAFSKKIVNDEMKLPGVMSRKNSSFPIWKKHSGNKLIQHLEIKKPGNPRFF